MNNISLTISSTYLITNNEQRTTNHELLSVCQEFEALFIYYLLKAMDKTIIRSDFLNENSNTNEILREMYYEELSKELSMAGGIGLGSFLYEQLEKSQKLEVRNQRLEVRNQIEEYNKLRLQYQLPLP